ncbi:MAG: DEAD/DEAH box helicase [Candidatus Woesearchaeota archaeon]
MIVINEDNKKATEIVQFKGFILDPFQIDAIKSIEKGNSVVVSAGTGTGKTLIADYIIEKALKEKRRVIYTSPIKALSNQKFRDFKRQYGDAVGLLTGDVTINHDAQIQIMTTEIYRNMLLNREYFDDLQYVIFDEVHYLNDPERGAIWEEAIIFSPEHVRFLCLSATIPNANQLALWIEKIHKHEVDVIIYNKRAVPLEHYVYTDSTGIKEIDSLDTSIFKKDKKEKKSKTKKNQNVQRYSNLVNLINILKQKEYLPCIVFSFSRKKTWENAFKVAEIFDFTTQAEKNYISQFFESKINDEKLWELDSVNQLRYLLLRGIAVHNAGLLPTLKEIVEILFSEGKIKVLCATETFALGINMPTKTAVFTDLRKWDGIRFRDLEAREYFQMAGRAGRRGIDKIGYVITMLNSSEDYLTLKKIMEVKSEPIKSQFDISYNTILNLVRDLPLEKVKLALSKSFYLYQNQDHSSNQKIQAIFTRKYKELEKFGYINNGKLTTKGFFATKIYSHEIAISEMIFDNILKAATEEEFLVLLASLAYEFKLADKFNTKNINKEVNRILNLISHNEYLKKYVKKVNVLRMYKIVTYWYQGRTFEELLDITNLAEGDIIRLFRNIIDYLRQLIKASSEIYPENVTKFESMIQKIDRDVIRVDF